MNAAVWFGATVFFVAGAGPAAASPDMATLLGSKNYPYFSVAIAQAMAARFFQLYMACSVVAVLHMLAEWLYFGKYPQRLWLGLVLGLCLGGLVQVYGIQPRLKAWHQLQFSQSAQSEAAAHAYRAWTLSSTGLNILVLAGLGVYLWRVANPTDPMRYLSATKFRS